MTLIPVNLGVSFIYLTSTSWSFLFFLLCLHLCSSLSLPFLRSAVHRLYHHPWDETATGSALTLPRSLDRENQSEFQISVIMADNPPIDIIRSHQDDLDRESAKQEQKLHPQTEPDEKYERDMPPDGGYGWVCVACVFFINAHTWGINSVSGKSLGLQMFGSASVLHGSGEILSHPHPGCLVISVSPVQMFRYQVQQELTSSAFPSRSSNLRIVLRSLPEPLLVSQCIPQYICSSLCLHRWAKYLMCSASSTTSHPLHSQMGHKIRAEPGHFLRNALSDRIILCNSQMAYLLEPRCLFRVGNGLSVRGQRRNRPAMVQ